MIVVMQRTTPWDGNPGHDHQPGPFLTVTQVSALLVYITATTGNGHNAAAQPEAGAIVA